MFLPLKDDTPLNVIRFQFVTVFILALNVVIFLLTGPLVGEQAALGIAQDFGVIPAELLGTHRMSPAASDPISEPLTLISYMFLHGGWLHLLSNMAFLWVFADNVEDAFGPIGFTLFYFVCGFAAAAAHVAFSPHSLAPLIGASGAVSGVIGAYLLLFPKAKVWVLLFMRIPIKFPALWILLAWIGFQVFSLFQSQDGDVQVAFWAHIGGVVAGMLITLIFRARMIGGGGPD
jgi:membrane associated rhomboid family serine protease